MPRCDWPIRISHSERSYKGPCGPDPSRQRLNGTLRLARSPKSCLRPFRLSHHLVAIPRRGPDSEMPDLSFIARARLCGHGNRIVSTRSSELPPRIPPRETPGRLLDGKYKRERSCHRAYFYKMSLSWGAEDGSRFVTSRWAQACLRLPGSKLYANRANLILADARVSTFSLHAVSLTEPAMRMLCEVCHRQCQAMQGSLRALTI